MPNSCKYAWIRRPVERSNGRYGLVSSFSWLRRRRLSSNPTASTDMDRYQTEPCKPSVIWRLARLEKRLDFRGATRSASAARRYAPRCMSLRAPLPKNHFRRRSKDDLATKGCGKISVLISHMLRLSRIAIEPTA